MCVLIYSFQMLIMKYIYVTCLEFNQILYRKHQNKKYIKDKLASIHWIVFSNQMGENIFDPIISGLGSKGGVSSPFSIPKSRHCLDGGGSLTHAWIFLKDLSTYTEALKCDHLSPKSDISPQKCSLFPRIDHSTTSI